MKLLHVGAAELNQTPLDWSGNLANILGCIQAAQKAGVQLLCLPELCITGYGCEDAFLSAGVQDTALEMLREIVPTTAGVVVCVGLPLRYRNAVLNTVAVVADKKILGFVAKRFLAGDGIHYEPRWFKPWPRGRRARFDLGEEAYPLGDIYFDLSGIKLGFEICEDAWVAHRPGVGLARKGIDVIFNPSASHFAFGKHEIRQRLVLEGSRAFGVTYVYANLLGNEAGRVIYDGGSLIATGGQLVARNPRFSFANMQLTSAVVDVQLTRMAQARTAGLRPELGGRDDMCVRAAFSFPELDPVRATPRHMPGSGDVTVDAKEVEFTHALTLGLFDYLRKSRAAGFVVSLSGGCDSTVVAALCAIMVARAVEQLGRAAFLQRLSYIKPLEDALDVRALVARLLTCVYQGTRNSTAITRDAAHQVAEAFGAEFLLLDVEPFVAGYTEMISQALHRSLSWEADDTTLQNIQARVRGPGVWMIANLKNALLLATSNRSEAAVGYATMDGDTCGGLSPIAGIDKDFLRCYLVWLEKEGAPSIGPVAALAAVNGQLPTAELRPMSYGQTDEQDLMPYDLLNAMERAAILHKQLPLDVYKQMRVLFPALAIGQLANWVERFFRLWCRNQWKRERYAPSFHLDDENLDPKTWCRFPVLSSGFERELAELQVYVSNVAKQEGKRMR